MAKKSFKKGVDSLIQQTGSNENNEIQKETKKKSPTKPKNKAAVKDDGSAVIDLGTKLTIEKAPEIKIALEEAIKNSDVVILKSNNVEDIDLSFIQMVQSAQKSCKLQKKLMKLDLTLPEPISQLLDNSGFGDILK